MSLENGDAVAIEWVASELKKALKPAFGDSYVQPVPIVEYRADAARSSIVLREAAANKNSRGSTFLAASSARWT